MCPPCACRAPSRPGCTSDRSTGCERPRSKVAVPLDRKSRSASRANVPEGGIEALPARDGARRAARARSARGSKRRRAPGGARLASGAPAARRASRAAPSAPPISLSATCCERDVENVGHELRPERRARAAADHVGLRERRASARERLAACRGTRRPRPPAPPASCRRAWSPPSRPDEGAAHAGIVVRRALALR